MRLSDKVAFGNNPILFSLIYPLILVMRLIWWILDPHKFCKHNWVSRKLEASYGVFGGMEVYKCSKCGKEDWDRSAEKRLKRNGLL